jgi:hypothetical protein
VSQLFQKRRWTLVTNLSDIGRISIDGIEEMGEVVFPHPSDGGIVLRCSVSRAREISEWSFHVTQKMNMRVVFYEKPDDESTCPECGGIIVVIRDHNSIDVIHSIPFCAAFKKQGNTILRK